MVCVGRRGPGVTEPEPVSTPVLPDILCQSAAWEPSEEKQARENASWDLEEWKTTMELVSKPNAIAAVWDSNPMTVVNHLTCVSRYIAFVVKR